MIGASAFMAIFSECCTAEHMKLKILSLANTTLDKLHQRYFEGNLHPMHYTDTLLLIANAYPILNDKIKWEEFGYILASDIKNKLEQSKSGFLHPGMLGGFGGTCFSVNEFNKSTGLLKRFASSLNHELSRQARFYLNYINAQESVVMGCYDVVSGIAGILYYLLDFSNDDKLLDDMLRYLVRLANEKSDHDRHPFGYHIIGKNQARNDEKLLFPEGHLNFGLAHGMIGPLISMSKAKAKGIVVGGLEEAIQTLLSLYEQFVEVRNGVSFWPTQLSIDDYYCGFQQNDIRFGIASWCYGNLGIARGLYKTAKYLHDYHRTSIYEDAITAIINRPVEEYNLHEAILCHGYASVLAVQMATYYSTGNPSFLNNLNSNISVIEKIMDVIDDGSSQTYYSLLEDDPSLLMGASGIILSLLSTVCTNMSFTKLLLID